MVPRKKLRRALRAGTPPPVGAAVIGGGNFSIGVIDAA